MKMTKFITILLSCVLIISTFAGCRKINGDMSSGELSNTSSIIYGIVDIVESENSSDIQSADADTASSDSSQSSSSNDNTTSSNDSDTNSSSNVSSIFTENIVSVGGGDNSDGSDEDGPVTFIEPDESGNTNTEIKEYNGQTFSTVPDEKTGEVKTVSIAANGSVFYKIMGVSNKNLTINSPDAYVVYNGTTYTAKNGVVSFTVVSDELSSAQILFEIGNKGSKAQGFTVKFTSPKGSWDNKEVISALGEEITVTVQAGDTDGYWWKYVATKDCTLKFYLLSGTDNGILSVTNNRSMANRSTDIDDELKSDSTGKYVELKVEAKDEIVINIGSKKSDTTNTFTLMIK